MNLIKNLIKTAIFAGTFISTAAYSQSLGEPKIGKTLAESKEWWPEAKKLPANTPNVIWILLDDAGFGASSAFGGLIHTPTFDSLANNGLRYTNFHTTGVCSPTRAALLTGRNHHNVHMGLFPHEFIRAGFPGYDAKIPPEKGTIAEILRESGYNTFQLGKWHLTPDEELTNAGPFDRWPSGKGFDHNYGFLGGATDQYKPDLVEDNYNNLKSDGRHLDELLADKAIKYVSHQKAAAPDKPFFLYWAPGATHSPHQVDAKWSDKYKGKFDSGWDVYREQVFEKQKKLGVIPANAKLPARSERVKAWKNLSKDEQKVYARFMEVYAGFLEHTDYQIGRLVSHLKTSGQLENTAIFVIIGDNGASKEGSTNGVIEREFSPIKADDAGQIAGLIKNYDKIGTGEVQTNYPTGWAQATNTPFKQWKADANSEGGTRNPLIVFYPNGIKEKGGIRNQYSHLIDLIPTTLDITGIKAPEKIRGYLQDPLQGTSLAYSFADAKAPSRHKTQYYYLFGSGAIYSDGWKAGFPIRPDFWDLFGSYKPYKPKPNDNKQVWELYNLNEDFNETIDLAKSNPAKLKELQALFDSEAKKNNVYPLINWSDIQAKYLEYIKKAKTFKIYNKE